MKFIVAVTALASLAQAAVISKRQDKTQNFEFQSFSAACEASSDQCTFKFNLNGRGECTASQPAFSATDANGASYKQLPNIGVTTCQDTTWNAVRNADGSFTISASNEAGLTGTTGIPSTDFGVANGVEAYTGSGIVILYGPPLSS
ncbi:hypothetical protein N0V93_000415 [Gnomoniopsis smithogilvyi]|uniref:Uncharacterized protein n=1 Tax=Gnomoniopsis smithogilvyi TaxID=1191159 RepID=A0A9W8Z1J7_9PEZI|nr:hypothetical protein N0V93_000415 [Gnomoniopsis smithogilvyi]